MKKVWIDAGHGGKDPGASGNGVVEKKIALQVATEAAKRLEREYEGVQCLLSRTCDVYLTLEERTDKANAYGAHVLVSIHCNAGGGAGGFETYTYSGKCDAAASAFQDVLHAEILSRLTPFQVRDRGQKQENLHMCRESCMPAVLTENLFVDVAADAERLKRSEVIEAIIAGHVAGIARFLSLKQKRKPQPKKQLNHAINILGQASATVEQAKAWAKSKNAPAKFVELADLYWKLAPQRGGVDPAVAYVQFAHETGYLYRNGRSGAGIDASYCNPCGLKITEGGGCSVASAHKRFKTWQEGITAHLDHLALYAGAAGYPKKDTPDPRHFATLRGTATTIGQLGGKWAPCSTYGAKLVIELIALRRCACVKKEDGIGIKMEGKTLCTGTVENGCTIVPVRPIAKALGAKVGWNGKCATVNGNEVVGAKVVDGTAHAPVRAILDACKPACNPRLNFDESKKELHITVNH